MKKKVFLALFTILITLYFRIPFWTDLPPRVRQLNQERAETIVRKNMTRTVAATASFPKTIPEAEREKILREKVRELIDAEPAQYEGLVSSLQERLDQGTGRRYSKDYLPEVDTYYYLLLTKNLLRNGTMGPSGHNGTFFNPLRCAPAGSWDRLTWHPYLGAAAYSVMRFFDKNISLIRAVAWVPVFLSLFMALAVLLLFWALDMKPLLAFLGSAVFLLSPFVVLRSNYGWYDTDPYIFIFSALAFGSLVLAIKKPHRSVLCGLGGGLCTSLLALFWPGWLCVVPFVMSGAAGLVAWDLFRSGFISPRNPFNHMSFPHASAKQPFRVSGNPGTGLYSGPAGKQAKTFGDDNAKGQAAKALRSTCETASNKKKGKWGQGPAGYLVAYTAASLLLAIVFLSPQSLRWTVLSGLSLFMKTGGTGTEPWPNLLLLISETGQMSVARWFSLTLSFGALVFSFLGAAMAGTHFLKAKDPLRFRQWLAILSICIPAMLLSLHGKRFVLHVILPLSLLSVFGMEWFMGFLKNTAAKITKKTVPPGWAALAVMLCVLPVTIADAWTTSQETSMVMDDPWFKVLNFLREKTPRDSIVFSWWSPGYFISGLAERRSVVDGGTQTRPENLWVAKALMRHDEREAVGIFRMLAVSGSEALAFLQKRGMRNDDAVGLILKIVSLDREKAREVLRGDWPEQEKEKMLDLVFGKNVPPPAYGVVYEDLVSSNVVLQQSDRWNFKRAEKILKMKSVRGRPEEAKSGRMADYFRKVSAIAGDPTPYQRPKPPFHQDKGLLFYENLVIDEVKKEAFSSAGGKDGVETQPIPLMYFKEGKWVTNASADPSSPLWAVFFNTGDAKRYRKAMLVRKELLESVLFQLYYFQGHRYRWIKPFTSGGGLDDVNYVAAFEIDFAAFDRRNEPGPS